MKKLHLEGVHQWCLCFEDVFCAVMRMLMALWLVYCGLKFVPVKCHSTYCSDRSFFLVFFKVWNKVISILNESSRY